MNNKCCILLLASGLMCKIGYTGVGTSIWYKTSQHRLKTILMRKLGKILYREAEILMHT